MALIKCPECEREISDTVKVCPHCGYKLSSKKKVSEKERKSVNLKTVIPISFLFIAVIVGAIFLVLYLNSPITKIANKLNNNDIKSAQEMFDKEIKDSDDLGKLQTKVISILNDKVSDYQEKASNYEKYEACYEFVQKNFPDADISDITNKVSDIKKSKDAYDRGVEKLENKEYADAISSFEKVAKEDGAYGEANDKIKECKDLHIKEVIEKIREEKTKGKPSITGVETDISAQKYLGSSEEIKKEYEELKIIVKDSVITRAKTQAGKRQYVQALNEIKEEIPKDFSEDADVIKVKKDITNKMVSWSLKEANKKAQKKNYTQALDILRKYNMYDESNKLQKKINQLEKKEKKAVIARFKKLKNGLTIKYDSVDKDYTVVSKGLTTKYINVDQYRNIEARAIVDKKDKNVDFQLVAGFMQDDWIFTDEVKFAAGKYRETYYIGYGDRYTNVGYGGIISEWMYLNYIKSNMDKLVPQITKARKTTIRFGGDGHGTRNHVLTASEKNNIKTVKEFCDLLNKHDYLYKYI